MFESSGLFVDRPIIGGGIPLSGLIGQWIMDDAHVSGTTVTDSIGGDNGTINDLPSVISAAGPGSHTARGFSGTNSVANITLASRPLNFSTAAFSIGGWIYLNDSSLAGSEGTRQTFFCSNIRLLDVSDVGAGVAGIGYHDNGANGFMTVASAIPSATWTHLFFTNDGAGGGGTSGANTIYVNGNSVSITTQAAMDTGGTPDTRFAALDTGAGNIAGRMYNWLVYSRAISAQEVLDIYNAQ